MTHFHLKLRCRRITNSMGELPLQQLNKILQFNSNLLPKNEIISMIWHARLFLTYSFQQNKEKEKMLLQAISTENGVFPFFGFPPCLPNINLKYIADFYLQPNTRAKNELRNDLKIERKAKIIIIMK